MSIANALASLNLLTNPICVKGVRERLRAKHALSWGLVVLTITAFVSLLVYLTGTRQDLLTSKEAAQGMFVPIVVIQGILLMFLGVGSVTSGLILERVGGLLDYQRLTPMRPSAKILGYLFGLPAREYFLFALTLPFLAFAVWVGEIPISALLHGYSVLFSSVCLYHMTALVVGMTLRKPRQASFVVRIAIVVLYLGLPKLSLVGMTFFEHLTILPTLRRILSTELSLPEFTGQFAAPDVAFFDWFLHPTTFTLMVQGFLFASMFAVVHRKWSREHGHPFSKPLALVFYAVALLFLVGGLWPIVANDAVYRGLTGRVGGWPIPRVEVLGMLTYVLLVISGLICLFLIHVQSPSRLISLKGLRRARKLSLPRVPPSSDAASSLPLTLAMVALTAAGCAVLLVLAAENEVLFESLPPWVSGLAPLALFASVALSVQALRERFSPRAFYVSVFLLWTLPLFTGLVMYAAWEAWVAGTYVALPFPPMALYLAVAWFLDGGTPGIREIVPPVLHPHLGGMTFSATLLYGGLALALQIERFRWRADLRQRVRAESEAA